MPPARFWRSTLRIVTFVAFVTVMPIPVGLVVLPPWMVTFSMRMFDPPLRTIGADAGLDRKAGSVPPAAGAGVAVGAGVGLGVGRGVAVGAGVGLGVVVGTGVGRGVAVGAAVGTGDGVGAAVG